jgi:putative flippase GtrA
MVVSSVLATVADYALAFSLVHGLGKPAWLGTALGCTLGAVVNYSINRLVAFRSTQAKAPEFVRYLVVSGTSLVLNTVGVSLLSVLLRPGLGSVTYDISWVIVRALVFYFWNVRLQTEYVFRPRVPRAPSSLGQT